MTYDVFLSYCPSMRGQADVLKAKLAENGLRCVDADSFVSGADPNSEFLRLLEQSRSLVLIASPDLELDGVQITSEVETAFKLKKPIIPYVTDHFELSGSFAFLTGNSVPIDAAGSDDAVDKLILAVKACGEQKAVVRRSRKKLMIALIAAAVVLVAGVGALLFALLSHPAPTDTGTHGELTWSYYEGNKTLVISGEGRGADYFADTNDEKKSDIPWNQYAEDIETVTVENGVTCTGMCTFYQMPHLRKVTLPDTLNEMSNSMFYGCQSLTEVTIPDSVNYFGGHVFFDCPITSLHIPRNVSTILSAPCLMCKELETITVDSDNPFFKAVDGVLYDMNMTRLIQYPAQKKDSAFTIPATVMTIDGGAFLYASALTRVEFSPLLTEIPDLCFAETGLTQLTLPDGITSIGMMSFGYCESLTQVKLNDGLTSVGFQAFFQCPELKEIVVPDSVTTVDVMAFCFGEQDEELGKYHTLIKASEGSDAIRYAKEYDLEYEIIP